VPKLVIFAVMKRVVKLKFIYLFIGFIFLIGCKQEIKRFIDPEDTRYSEDVRSISKKINKNPNDAELYYKRANTFFFEEKFQEALADIRIAIELNPEVAFYHFKEGEYYMSGDTADAKMAEKSYLRALELEPGLEEAHFKLGILYFAKQRYKDCANQMEEILKNNSSNPDAFFFLGMINKETGDTVRAIQRFQEAVELNNTYYNAYMQLGLILLESNPELSLKYLNNAIRIDEFSDEAHYTKGLLLQNKNENAAAKEFYKRTLELNPGHRLAYYNLAFIEVMETNYIKALDYLDKLLFLDPEYVPALHFRGVIYKELKQFDKAEKDLKSANELEPDNEEIMQDLIFLRN
jgi:tetratricopeptide (TPR) repeat protein